jgi:hypothetical protein
MLASLLGACASASFASEGDPVGEDRSPRAMWEAQVEPSARESRPYPLDDISRALVPGAKLLCEQPGMELVTYRGERLRYQRPLRVHPAFREHLRDFEVLVAELAERHFGRAPKQILHFGAYACRAMRIRTYWISEHALGNAIDVAGFDFGPLPGKAARTSSLPRALQRGFSVRVDKHWHGVEADAPKAAFLRELADAVIERPAMFRAFIGPDYPKHDNHFHFANPPYRLVKVGDVRRWSWW